MSCELVTGVQTGALPIVLVGALGDAERHGGRPDALGVVGGHERAEAAAQALRRLQQPVLANLEILEQHLGLGNAAQAHGWLALADPQALGRSGLGIAQGDEAADALLDAVVEHPREDKVQPRDAAAGEDRKRTRLNFSNYCAYRMPSYA